MRFRALVAALGAVFLSVAAEAQQGVTMPPAIPPPQDIAYLGVITLSVDATDTARGIIRVQETVPVSGGPVTLLYPQWLPGKHAPRGPVNLLAGLQVRANGQLIPWRRDPVNVYAFHIDAPANATALQLSYQYLSPTASNQERVTVSREIVELNWNTVILYPAGYYNSRIRVRPTLTLPDGWQFGSALDGAEAQGATTQFAETTLETLVDSPLFAGRYLRRIDLDPSGRAPVHLNIVADRADQLQASEAQIRLHRNLIQQAYRLFGSHHYDHYDFLFALSDRVGGLGVEHHRSNESGVGGGYFLDWSNAASDRGILPHEFIHSWNGKFRRPADLWTPDYSVPMRGSLLWVYEGMTQYYGEVLTARSGLWTRQQALDSLAMTAATYQNRVGRTWRALEDTTADPVAAARRPQAWRSWQRSEDYYVDAELMWFDADTLIRERSGGRRSLDDFARAFLGINDGSWTPLTYVFEDVVAALNRVQPYDWATFLHAHVDAIDAPPPLDGIGRGGYRLVYTPERSAFQRTAESWGKYADFLYSIGLQFGDGGAVTQVQWDGPAFNQGITVGSSVVAVNGVAYSADGLRRAITTAQDASQNIELLVKNGDQYRTVALDYHGGLRYPHLERAAGADRLGAILAAR